MDREVLSFPGSAGVELPYVDKAETTDPLLVPILLLRVRGAYKIEKGGKD